jgi:hypothetical protein
MRGAGILSDLGRWTASTIGRTVGAFLVSAAVVAGALSGCRIMRRPPSPDPVPLPWPDFIPPAGPIP